MPPKGYVIAQVIEIHDQDGFARYRELVGRPWPSTMAGSSFAAVRRNALKGRPRAGG